MGLLLRIHTTDFTREIVDSSDAAAYSYAAKNLIQNGMLVSDRDGAMLRGEAPLVSSSTVMPGMPIFLAALYLINDSTAFIYIIQIALSMVTLILIYKMMRLIGVSFAISAFALAIAAVYPAFSYNLDIILTETVFTTSFMSALYLFIKFLKCAEENKKRVYYLLFSSIFFMCATMIRAQALPFIAVEIFFVLVYLADVQWKKRIKFVGIILATALIFMIPLWIRNWLTFHDFWLLTESGVNPKIWGAQPYFLDMTSTLNMDYDSLASVNASISPEVYWKWRIFGFFNFMWYDFWDENLFHPAKILSFFNGIHLAIIVPTIAAIPFIVRKAQKEVLLIAAVPLLFTLMCMPYHGLARYVFPSIPCVIVLLGIMVNWLWDRLKKHPMGKFDVSSGESLRVKWQKAIDTLFRGGYFLFSIVFSLVLVYSVYIFSWDIKTEMSEYRLERAYNISVNDVESFEEIQSIELVDNKDLWNIVNVNQLEDNKFQGIYEATPIMNVTVPQVDALNNNEKVVTKVELTIPGGKIFDAYTIYWSGEKAQAISEDDVYGRFPRNIFQSTQTVYIDDNVSSLMIVPSTVRGSTFSIEGIKITKYIVP